MVQGARTVAGAACVQVLTISLLIKLISQGIVTANQAEGLKQDLEREQYGSPKARPEAFRYGPMNHVSRMCYHGS